MHITSLRAGVVGHVEPGLHLDHGLLLSHCRRRAASRVAAVRPLVAGASRRPASPPGRAAASSPPPAPSPNAWCASAAATRRSRPCRPRATRCARRARGRPSCGGRILPYRACRTSRGISTRRVLAVLSLTTIPISTRFGMATSLGFSWFGGGGFLLGVAPALVLNRLDAGDRCRRCLRSSLGASSRSVCAWSRRRNKFSAVSFRVSASCSSLISRSSGLRHRSAPRLSGPSARPYTGRRRMNRTLTGILWAKRAKHIRAAFLRHPADLVQHRARPNHRGPVLRLAFALAHAGFQGNRGDRLVGENADVQPAFGAEVLLGRDAAGLDRLRADPAALQWPAGRSRRSTTRLPRLALPLIRPLWLFRCLTRLGHQRHRCRSS